MTSSNQDNVLETDAREIARLVGKARETGRPDDFFGKRGWRRYELGLRLEVTTGSGQPEDTWEVTMHNISGGGFGFWSKRPLAEYEQIFVREWSDAETTDWLAAHVAHCTTGVQGYLVGASFENPAAPDDQPPMSETVARAASSSSTGEPLKAETERPPRREGTFRTKCAFATASAACAASAMTLCADLFLPSASWTRWAGLFLALLAVCILAGLFGSLMFRREARFLADFRHTVVRMTTPGAELPVPAQAPTQELIALRQAFVDLGSRWKQWEGDERAQRHKLEELNHLKSNILSIVSHDLRTPLTSILLYAEMLKEDGDTLAPEDRRHFTEIICTECTRLSRLVDDLLEVQRLESDRMQWDIRPQDLSGTIHACARVFEAMAKSKSIEFTVDCPPTLPPTNADADKISQVLSNLLSNAMKYAPNGGKVRLSAEARGSSLLLRVADSGAGIPRDKWDQLFGRFSQLGDPNVTEIDGFGLGLYIVKRIVECHGGVAWLDSEVGRGSEFSVSLPLRTAAGEPPRDHTLPPSAGRVLVCDPDPELAAILVQTLRWGDFDARVCHSGARLLARLEHGDVDVVITELLLPDMNADEVLSALENFRDRQFRVIVHSYADADARLTSGIVDVFLRRPVTKEELLEAVRNALKSQSSTRRQVLILRHGPHPSSALYTCLSQAGCAVEQVDSTGDVDEKCRSTRVDVVIAADDALSEEWEELRAWTHHRDRAPRIIVLCESVRKRHQRLAETHGVIPLEYQSGLEATVLGTVLTATAKPTLECNS